jgi:hypothetical protein
MRNFLTSQAAAGPSTDRGGASCLRFANSVRAVGGCPYAELPGEVLDEEHEVRP